MMRPIDWAPLASSDPVPGDPIQLTAIARRHAELASELSTQAANLRTLASSEGWDADAGRLFVSSATDVANQLDGAQRRYTAVAEALNEYAPHLEQAQREADAALTEAQTAQAVVNATQPAPAPVTYGTGPADPWADDPAVEAARRARAVNDAFDGLNRARQRLHHAEDLRTQQARRAATRIREAVSHGDLRDSWWDKVKNWTGDTWDSLMKWTREHACLLEEIASRCSEVASALSWVATAMAFIPCLAPLGVALEGVALELSAVTLACHLLLALSGEAKWADVAFDVVGLVSFGVGRKAETAVTKGTRIVQGTAEQAIKRRGAEAMKRALRTGGQPLPAAGTRAARGLNLVIRRRAAEAAKGSVEGADKLPFSVWVKNVYTLDARSAQELSKAKELARLAGTRRAAEQYANVQAAASRVAVAHWGEVLKHGIETWHELRHEEPAQTFCRVGSP